MNEIAYFYLLEKPILMRKIVLIFIGVLLFSGCKSTARQGTAVVENSDFTIAFGSCNKHTLKNPLWNDISASQPDVWIWGGDIVYADTKDMDKLRRIYIAQNKVKGYKKLKNNVPVIGTWDDHDYGLNDGGVEFTAKRESQIEFLNFMGVSNDSPRREQEGVYTAHNYDLLDGKVKVIVLDTRYFRTALTPDTETKKRNKPNVYGKGTILGEQQWQWLETELKKSDADFNVIVSSIQFLSNEHGFECWGNFPHEVDKMKKIITDSKAKATVVLSGDRHISEFSKADVEGLSYPLIDFTSSGLTHVYSKFNGEPNPFRVGKVVSVLSYGLLQFDLKNKRISFKMMGDNGEVLGEMEQKY